MFSHYKFQPLVNKRTVICGLCSTVLCLATTLDAATPTTPKHLIQAEILFEAQRGHAFDALLKLNSGQVNDNLENETARINSGTINKNVLLLNYGLSLQVEKNIKAALNINPLQRNHNAYLLAKFYDKKQQPVKTIQALEMIDGDIKLQDKLPLQQLTSLAYIRVGKYNAAVALLENLVANKQTSVYIQYNLALALLQSGNEEKGLSTLASLGQLAGKDTEQLAIIDLANLKLGNRYLDKGQPTQAKIYFNRVHLDSPFIEQTLLVSGWAAFSLGEIERAVVPWTLLHNSKILTDSVIEAKMALPYAYAKLDTHGKAANLYGQTIKTLEAELTHLNTAIKLAQNGKLKQHLINSFETQPIDTYTQLVAENQKQPFYLHRLLTDPQFRLLADSMHDLILSKNRLHQQQQNIDAYNKHILLKQKQYKKNTPLQKNQISDYQQLDNHKKQLLKLSSQLNQLNNKLRPVLIRAGKKLSELAVNILKQQTTKLESYRLNALFALAESYTFATRKQQ